jgi:predicted  nucleic acid-binding Zn-ribbon protein
MSTLRENLNALLQLQQLDSEKDKLMRQRSQLDTGSNLAQQLDTAQTELSQCQSQLSKTSGELKDAELELAGIERKIKDYESKMRQGAVTNTREMMNFEKEFGQMNRQRAALDDKILTLMEQSDLHTTAATNADQKVQNLDRDLTTLKSAFHGDLTKIDAALGRLGTTRIEISALVDDPNLLKRYESLRAKPANKGIAIAHTANNTCGACHMQIGTIAVTQAAGGTVLAICENCGRIMA